MSIVYCLPIIEESEAAVRSSIEQYLTKYDYFEVWLDYLSTVDDNFLDFLKKEYANNLVLLFRRQNLEEIQMPLARRIEIMQHFADSEALFDLDLTSQKSEIDAICDKSLALPLILSYHNYSSTPDQEELLRIVEQMHSRGASICKLACFCKSERDALRLLELRLELNERKINSIVLGMGAAGVSTRIFGTLWGNAMIFAPTEREKESAPGQLTRVELETIFSTLE